MSASLPRFRGDLVVSLQATAEGVVFIVKDPVRGQFFRFREAEYFITQQLDGATALDAARQRAESRFGAELSNETLGQFIKRLQKNGLLESERNGRERRRPGRIQGNFLYLRVRLFNPDRLLERLVSRLRFFFTPYFLVISAAFILAAVFVAFAQWEDVTRDFSRVYQLSAIPLVVLAIFVVITAHEFAHGLTCKYFGGQVHEMGFLLMYFQPALYCNVSDAWLFPEKSRRLWVGIAGPYFELFLWSLATLLWRVSDVETSVNSMAFIVMTSSGVKTLLNFNPLLKWDGYYLLSDWLGIPNLRKKSFRHIGDRIKKLFGLDFQIAQDLSARERRVCLTYGLVAAVCSFSVLGFAFAKLGGYLIDQSQPVALLLFSGLLGTKLRRRFQKFFGRGFGSSDLSDDDDDFDTTLPPEVAESRKPDLGDPRHVKSAASQTPAPAATPKVELQESREKAPADLGRPDPEHEKAEPAAAGKTEPAAHRKKKKRRAWKRRIALAALAGATLAVLFLMRMELRIVGAFAVLPWENADVRSAVAGIIEEIYVDEGDAVKTGDQIARLSDRDLLADLRKTEAQINQTRANLKLLETGPTADEIEIAKAAALRAEERLKYAQSRLARDKSLFEQSLLAQAAFEDTQELAKAAEGDLAAAQGKLKVMVGGSRPEEIDATKAALEGLDMQRRYIQEQLRLLKVVSPAAGIVATPSRQLKELKRQLVNKGDLIVKVYDFKTVTAEIIIPEKEIADIKVGQEVALKVRSFPDETFYGKVTSIATAAQANSSGGVGPMSGPSTAASPISVSSKTILVTTQIANSSLLLKAQMTGQAKIYCGQRRIFDLVMRRLSRTVKVEFWSWW